MEKRTKYRLEVIFLKSEIAVLGGGSWGTALAMVLAKNGHRVSMWIRNEDQAKKCIEDRENKKYLPGPKLPENLIIETDLKKSVLNKDILLLAVPTYGVRGLLEEIRTYVDKEQILTNVAKGIENNTLDRVSEICGEILPDNPYVILSGPSHAEEVGIEMPTTVVVASEDMEIAEKVQDVFMNEYFRVYTNSDVIGVELGGALKNIIALGAGISDGMKFGDNTKAALMTRGIFEMAKLGEKMGAKPETFSGLSGIGDLIVTCTSMHSRNRRAGILIGEGLKVEEATKQVGMVVEGIKTTKSAYNLSEKYGVEMPITEELYRVLYEGESVAESMKNLMGRNKKGEIENSSFHV